MGRSKPSCWRAFWVTATVVGVVNTALAAFYWTLPVELLPKSGGLYGRDPADWLAGGFIAINLPGIIFAIPIILLTNCQSEIARITLTQVLGTLFWALIAARLEQDISATVAEPAKPSALHPDAPPESN